MRRIIILSSLFIIMAFTATSCESSVTAEFTMVGSTPAITETLAPTATATPTEAPTPTPEVSVSELVKQFELTATPGYENRTFAVEQRDGATLLVDQYNKAPKLVKSENGSWRELDLTNPADAEVMYGNIAQVGATYIRTGIMSRSDGPWGRIVGPKFMGDWEVKPIEYKGEQVNVYYLIGALRDGEGALHMVRIALDSPDVLPEHYTEVWCYDKQTPGEINPGSGGSSFPQTLEESLQYLEVGETIGFTILERNVLPKAPFIKNSQYSLINTEQYIFVRDLYNQYPEIFQQMSPKDRENLDQLKWPEGVLTFAATDSIGVMRNSTEDCFK